MVTKTVFTTGGEGRQRKGLYNDHGEQEHEHENEHEERQRQPSAGRCSAARRVALLLLLVLLLAVAVVAPCRFRSFDPTCSDGIQSMLLDTLFAHAFPGSTLADEPQFLQ